MLFVLSEKQSLQGTSLNLARIHNVESHFLAVGEEGDGGIFVECQHIICMVGE